MRCAGEVLRRDGTVHRTAEPLCGAIAQDLLGTVQGRWFVPGTARSTAPDPHWRWSTTTSTRPYRCSTADVAPRLRRRLDVHPGRRGDVNFATRRRRPRRRLLLERDRLAGRRELAWMVVGYMPDPFGCESRRAPARAARTGRPPSTTRRPRSIGNRQVLLAQELLLTCPSCCGGASGTRRSARGSLYGANRSRANACRSASAGAGPGRATTNAVTTSPHVGSGDADHRDLGHGGMLAQRRLNLQRRELVAAALDDVARRASEEPDDAALVARADVAGPEAPLFVERRLGRRGSPKYPENICGERTRSSPGSPSPPPAPVVDDVDRSPPAARARRRRGRGRRRTGSRAPCRSRSSRSARGSSGPSPRGTRRGATPAAPPTRWSRGAACAPRAAHARACGSSPRDASISFTYIVGTPMKTRRLRAPPRPRRRRRGRTALGARPQRAEQRDDQAVRVVQRQHVQQAILAAASARPPQRATVAATAAC